VTPGSSAQAVPGIRDVPRNDYGMRLFNGDIGLILPDPGQKGKWSACFRKSDGGIRLIAPARLPEHETVFALTVHKCQGSEFDELLLLLPDRDAPVLTRELIYTAITRAKKGIEIWSDEELFIRAVSRRIERSSGLRETLWGSKQTQGAD
jgi:exodeoxyribonuclease V alpha subunit